MAQAEFIRVPRDALPLLQAVDASTREGMAVPFWFGSKATVWPPDPGSLGCTVTVAGPWLVKAGWPLVAVVLVVAVVLRRDV
ncbi:hypothetical protein ACFRIB_21400 [Streptomyces mirabilis]|uniref:hypothetical protein n=1 Tax=Streptomyces mirabilis TaxID=68239 RepID=UPI0036C19B07